MGKPSGGFGAIITPMLRPDLFGGLATHVGDGMYECSYVPEFANAVRFLRGRDGDIFAWWEDFQSRTAFTRECDSILVMTRGVAARFRDELAKIGATDVHFELFDTTPMGIDYRYVQSLAFLAERWR